MLPLPKFLIILTRPAVLAFFVLIFGLLVTTAPASFAQNSNSSTSLSVSPVSFDLPANPGDVITNEMKVSNLSDGALDLDIHLENIANAGEEGQVELTESDTKYALNSWIEVKPSKFTVSSKETKILSFTIRVPANAEPGGHYGSILVGTVSGTKLGSTGAQTVQRVGSLILVTVSGQSKEMGTIKSFQAKSFNGGWDEVTSSDGKATVLIAKNENLTNEKTTSYFSRGPVAFDLVFNNQGNVHFKPVGVVNIYNLFGHKIAELPVDPHNVFPGSDRRVTVIWPSTNLFGGYYRAQALTLYGSTHQSLTSETTFWAFPAWLCITLAVLILLAVILRKRLIKVFRVLVRGE